MVHHQETPSVDAPMKEVGVAEHIHEVSVQGRGGRHGQGGVQRYEEGHQDGEEEGYI